jgi:hypothetical protein
MPPCWTEIYILSLRAQRRRDPDWPSTRHDLLVRREHVVAIGIRRTYRLSEGCVPGRHQLPLAGAASAKQDIAPLGLPRSLFG